MQGTLWKWTNYISGWQSRWFVLDSGILSYYMTQDEMTQGSRRSYKAASCEIRVDKNNEVALSIITPDKACLYLKAGDKTERQKWVVALAMAKMSDQPIDTPGQQESLITRSRPIKSKMSELRDTCTHLTTQVKSIKAASNQNPPDIKSLEALTSTLTITCDDFLRLLQECLDHSHPSTPIGMGGAFTGLSNKALEVNGSSLNHTHPAKHKTPPAHVLESLSHDKHVRFGNGVATGSSERRTHSRSNSDIFITPTGSPNLSPPPSPLTPHGSTTSPPTDSARTWTVRERALAYQSERPLFQDLGKPEIVERKIETFFTKIEHRFGDIVLKNEDQIPTSDFIICSRELLPFFDALSPTAFAPIKADIGGNIDKAARKYQEDPDSFALLQYMMEDDIKQGTTEAGSAIEALLWLKRASQFIYLFLGEIVRGEKALDIAAGKAYSQSLRRHHNWLVRGAFNLALRAFPYYPDFLKTLGSDGSPEGDKQVVVECTEFAQDLGEVCFILETFLTNKNIETHE